MGNTRIFISYRRDENTLHAGWIYDRLAREFGHENVFLDHTIQPGDDFVEVLSEKVESCDVLLAVIGKSWLTIADATGRPRIQNPEDFVAIEIGAALRRKVRVIPILVGGGRMPGTTELPEELAPLARRQAHELPDNGFISALEKLFPMLQKSQSLAASIGVGAPVVSTAKGQWERLEVSAKTERETPTLNANKTKRSDKPLMAFDSLRFPSCHHSWQPHRRIYPLRGPHPFYHSLRRLDFPDLSGTLRFLRVLREV